MNRRGRFGGISRSRLMSLIRGRNNKSTELRLLNILRRAGITGWRRHLPMPGTPDFTFRKSRMVIFVDGCFWHGCQKCFRRPAKNKEFWARKISSNQKRDRRVDKILKMKKWRVIRIRECGLRWEKRIIRRILNKTIQGKRSSADRGNQRP